MSLLDIENEIDSVVHLANVLMLMADGIVRSNRETGNALGEVALIILEKLQKARDGLDMYPGDPV